MSTCGDLDRNLALECRHINAGPQDGIDGLDCFDPVEIAAVAYKSGIVGCADDNEKVARRRRCCSDGQFAEAIS